jgi:ribosomal protein S12 methylthiotransferase accessory factor
MVASLRIRTAARTLDVAEALMSRVGISRVADITRMDRLGLPVFASIRPRGLSLRVHAGKGLLPIEARLGALMEAIEAAAAEPRSNRWTGREASVAELAAQFGNGFRWIDLAPRVGVKVRPNEIVLAVECEDLTRDQPVLLPAELVFVPFEPEGRKEIFGWSSTGLAAGNSVEEATLHALFEVLERDAISLNTPSDESLWIGPSEMPEPFCSLATAWRRLGVRLAVRYVPNPYQLPCFEAFLHEQQDEVVNLAGGSGLHVARAVALSRAVCEAAQARLSHIHGGRDDITDFYSKYAEADRERRRNREKRLIESIFHKGRTTCFDDLPDASPAPDVSSALASIFERMHRVGLSTVLRYQFSLELAGLSVVRVVVPGCADVEGSPMRVGPRLLSRLSSNS